MKLGMIIKSSMSWEIFFTLNGIIAFILSVLYWLQDNCMWRQEFSLVVFCFAIVAILEVLNKIEYNTSLKRK